MWGLLQSLRSFAPVPAVLPALAQVQVAQAMTPRTGFANTLPEKSSPFGGFYFNLTILFWSPL
jgi:hypothetical protein